MGGLLVDILIFLGLLFILVLIFAPIYYYVNRDKELEKADKEAEEHTDESS